jgi:hypothetical protein
MLVSLLVALTGLCEAQDASARGERRCRGSGEGNRRGVEMTSKYNIGERVIDSTIADTDAPYPHGVGTVVKLGRRYLYVRTDISGEVVKYDEDDVGSISDNAGHSSIMLYTHLRALGHSHAAISRWLDDPEWRKECRKYRKTPTIQLEGALQIEPKVLK